MTDRSELDQMLARVLGPAGHDSDTAVPGLRAHLAGCPACREEFESLRDRVSGDGQVD